MMCPCCVEEDEVILTTYQKRKRNKELKILNKSREQDKKKFRSDLFSKISNSNDLNEIKLLCLRLSFDEFPPVIQGINQELLGIKSDCDDEGILKKLRRINK